MSSWQRSGNSEKLTSLEREVGRHFSPHQDPTQTGARCLELGEGPVGSQAGACGAWGQQAGGGELAPPPEEGRGEAASDLRPAASLELTSREVNVWLLQMRGQGCFGVL